MEENQGPDGNNNCSERSEAIRSRWTPKPEQILILESIFNSGMVNPPKDETVRIRKLIEKFGSVGDANVFYWFQNRRSRSRRKQRQMQAEEQRIQQAQASSPAIQCGGGGVGVGFVDSSQYLVGSSSSGVAAHENGVDNLLLVPNQLGFQGIEQASSTNSSILGSSNSSNFPFQTGFITVFINGVAIEVPKGSLDFKAMFGEEVILVHSSGVPVSTNEFGFLMQTLQHGQSYFLVSRTT